MTSNVNLLAFALAFVGCVLVTPLVTRVASWAGAIDRPDQFRRIHKGAVPRLGGLGLAFGLALSVLPVVYGGYLRDWVGFPYWWSRQWSVVVAAVIVLIVGAIDDAKGMKPRLKLLGQALAVVVLFKGGIRIERVAFMGWPISLSYPLHLSVLGYAFHADLLSLAVTMIWFLGCMNVWNLIDGMDGLASGVGLLVSGTLMLVAIHGQNQGSAIMAAALAGSLAGFLLYNWHPACIFLGDSGSLLIGLLIGVIGVQDSLKGTTAVSILFPILAMGLPISDTAMAIFRRWVRNLPLSSADRRHIHHLLIGMGLSPHQAVVCLYCFTGFLCGVVLLGVAKGNEFLALVMGVFGCLAFLLILTSRRDELSNLWDDLQARLARGKQERTAAKITYEAIQRIELCDKPDLIWETVLATAQSLGCDRIRLSCSRYGRTVLLRSNDDWDGGETWGPVSGPTATFRLTSGEDLLLSLSVHQCSETEVVADIAFRFLQRLSLATAERMERLLAKVTVSHYDEELNTPSADGAEADAASDDDRAEIEDASAVELANASKLSVVFGVRSLRAWRKSSAGWLRWASGIGRP
jgi:UDP-GlcNAc:undecaprenyl-phosphate/decaprenyl-phosphate GlcNAc-1-phosphate transferase